MFGLMVLLPGDAAAFLVVNSVCPIMTVRVKCMVAGCCAGLAYRAVSKETELLVGFVAGAYARS